MVTTRMTRHSSPNGASGTVVARQTHILLPESENDPASAERAVKRRKSSIPRYEELILQMQILP